MFLWLALHVIWLSFFCLLGLDNFNYIYFNGDLCLFFPCLHYVTCTHVAVKSIKKQHLVEIRSMGNPPNPVKLALESICLLLGENATDWKAIRSVIMCENFISTIVNFSTENIS